MISEHNYRHLSHIIFHYVINIVYKFWFPFPRKQLPTTNKNLFNMWHIQIKKLLFSHNFVNFVCLSKNKPLLYKIFIMLSRDKQIHLQVFTLYGNVRIFHNSFISSSPLDNIISCNNKKMKSFEVKHCFQNRTMWICVSKLNYKILYPHKCHQFYEFPTQLMMKDDCLLA